MYVPFLCSGSSPCSHCHCGQHEQCLPTIITTNQAIILVLIQEMLQYGHRSHNHVVPLHKALVQWHLFPLFPWSSFDWTQNFLKISPSELIGFVHAAHATDVENGNPSWAGHSAMQAQPAIAYKSKLWTVIATSLKEPEFVAVVHAGKTARYLWFLLEDLGFTQQQPTTLHEDNKAVMQW